MRFFRGKVNGDRQLLLDNKKGLSKKKITDIMKGLDHLHLLIFGAGLTLRESCIPTFKNSNDASKCETENRYKPVRDGIEKLIAGMDSNSRTEHEDGIRNIVEKMESIIKTLQDETDRKDLFFVGEELKNFIQLKDVLNRVVADRPVQGYGAAGHK